MKSASKFFDLCNIYILLWVLGHVQGMFITSSLISMLFYIPFAIFTIYYIAQTIVSYKPKGVMRALSVFFVFLVIYGAILSIFNNAQGVARNSFIMMLIASLGPIFPFYVFSKQGKLTESRMMAWFFVFLVVAIIDFEVNKFVSIRLSGADEITNNTAYYFAGLLPFLFLFEKKRFLQIAALIVILFYVITGMKRGAIIVSALILLWLFFITIKYTDNKHNFVIILLTIALFYIGVKFVGAFYASSDYFQYRVNSTLEGSTSNRLWIYSTLWEHFKNDNNLFHLLFGEGAYHTQVVTGYVKAHNDWLELLIDCGVLGIVLYLFYWISFIKGWLRSRQQRIAYAMIGACFIFTFIRTFFSMSFCDMPFYTTMIMGYCFSVSDTQI